MIARILIAEDHPDSMELMRYLLQAYGYPTLSADDGNKALELARRERPDLLICDLRMPGLNGYELVRELRNDKDLRHIPMVAVTAFAMLGDREKVLAAGFDDYFSKPIEADRFVGQLERHIPEPLRVRRASARMRQGGT